MKLTKRTLAKIPLEPCPQRDGGCTTMIRTAVLYGGELLAVTFYDVFLEKSYYRVHITFDGRTANIDYRTGQWNESKIGGLCDNENVNLYWHEDHIGYANLEDSEAGQEFFGYKNTVTFRAICKAQDERESRKRRSQEETERELITRVFNAAPPTPDNAVSWALDNPLKNFHYIFFHTEKVKDPLTGLQQKLPMGYCTHCHENMVLPFEPAHKMKWTCLQCGVDVKMMAERYGHTKLIHYAKMRIFQKNVEGAVYVRLIDLVLDFRNNFRGSCISYADAAVYYFGKGEAYEFRPEWGYEGRSWRKVKCVYEISGYDETYPVPDDFLNDTCLRHSHLAEFMKSCNYPVPMMYLAAYVKNPSLEYLLGFGLKKVVIDKVSRNGFANKVLDLTKTRPRDILGVSQPEVELFKEKRWDCSEIYSYQVCKAAGFIPNGDDIALLSLFAYHQSKMYRELFRTETARRILSFLRRQQKRSVSISYLFTAWKDYLKECGQLGYDLTDSIILYPPDLKKAHQKTTSLLQQKREEEARLKSEAETKQYRKQLEKRAYLAYEDRAAGLFIRLAQSRQELVSEGAALHHCVGGYANDHMKGKTTILFIRRISEPDKPYFTLEFRSGKIQQNRGNRNCDPPEDVVRFAEKWLQEVALKKPQKQETEICIQVA